MEKNKIYFSELWNGFLSNEIQLVSQTPFISKNTVCMNTYWNFIFKKAELKLA